jgi:hypothetical protein
VGPGEAGVVLASSFERLTARLGELGSGPGQWHLLSVGLAGSTRPASVDEVKR